MISIRKPQNSDNRHVHVFSAPSKNEQNKFPIHFETFIADGNTISKLGTFKNR